MTDVLPSAHQPVSADESAGPVVLIDSRTRARRMLAPLVTGGAVLLATGYVASVNPNDAGHYPLCPTKWFLGVDCPGCGGLRCVYSLAHGDVATAADHNLLAVLLLPLVAVWWVLWVVRAWRGTRAVPSAPAKRRERVLTVVVWVLVFAFTLARNLPFVPYLNSAA